MIIEDLMDDRLSLEEIAVKHDVSYGMVQGANKGLHRWTKEFTQDFPIRKSMIVKFREADQMFEEGVSDQEIGEKLNLDEVDVLRAKLRYTRRKK